jgi:D-glycero-alpha-D-manno-heptose-7-phosphate kinase
MKALNTLEKKNITDSQLAKKAIYFEQKIMHETVGSQDQIAASIGGFNKIIFKKKDKFKIKKISKKENIKKLEKNLVLIYTGINRTAHKIASSYVNKLSSSKKNYIEKICEHVTEGEKLLNSGNIDDFGKLLNHAWILKKKLSNSISNKRIDDIYNFAIKNGSLGGKLLGAGGGGFLLMYMKKKHQKSFFKQNKKLINIPFNFTNEGSQVIFRDLNR